MKMVGIILFVLLVYTRLVGLDWGLPYPMHPDERNMVNAVQSLNCEIRNSKFEIRNFKDCFNPHFFAYGQLPLYANFFMIKTANLLQGKWAVPMSYSQGALGLRLISALASIVMVFVLIRIINLIRRLTFPSFLIIFLLLTLVPYAIQFSHFGTTESLLMLLYSSTVYFSIKVAMKQWNRRTIACLGLALGLAIGVKVSSILFATLIPIAFLYSIFPQKKIYRKKQILYWIRLALRQIWLTFCVILIALIVAVITSPHNFISWQDFLGSMRYEISVATGSYRAFYTRQFEYALPFLFQMITVFPYVIGWPQFLLSMAGFLCLSWRDRRFNIVRLAILIYLIPAVGLYAKWTRFVAPVLPMMSILAVFMAVSICQFVNTNMPWLGRARFVVLMIFIGITIAPGIAYLSIYQNPDVRFRASEWIYSHVAAGSYVLSETANVVDIPLAVPGKEFPARNYEVISFDFYHLHENQQLVPQLQTHLGQADYIFVPSRRVFADHTCYKPDGIMTKLTFDRERCRLLEGRYPVVNDYYRKLFYGQSEFEKVAEISSYPRISVSGMTLFELVDEEAEETWTVFDHPVIRIYKKI